MSRLTPEREADIRLRVERATFVNVYDAELLLAEIDALRAERDEVIVGVYRAAAEIAEKHAMQKQGYEFEWDRRELHAGGVTARQIGKEILALTPQSAIDAVERDRRELVGEALLAGMRHSTNLIRGEKTVRPTYESVLESLEKRRAEVKRA